MLIKKIIFLVIFFLFSFLLSLNYVYAADSEKSIVEKYKESCVPENCDKSSKKYDSNCASYCGGSSLNDMVGLLAKGMRIILSLVGSLTLLAFIYGGVVFLTSAGSGQRVEEGKQVIIGATIGLAVVLMSYTIIGFVFKLFGVTDGWNQINWF